MAIHYTTVISLLTVKVCLVGVKIGRMKNKERKIGWKMTFSTVCFKIENKRDRKWRGK